MATATLSSKGQVTIPVDVRKRLGIDTGDRIEFIELPEGEFVIRAVTRDIRELKGIIPKPSTPVSIEDMNRAIATMGRSDEEQ
jgi:antitoxin PrlF